MKLRYFSLMLCSLLISAAQSAKQSSIPERLQVSENRRFLVDQDGRPFFYLADTAWEIFQRLDREEADEYLRDRVEKGFTAVQIMALVEHEGLRTPNVYGHLPLTDEDPTRPDVKDGPDNDYWDHADYIIRRANELGLYVALLPTWGSFWHDKDLQRFTPQNARTYGEWIGHRYRDAKIIWVMGGDRNPENDYHRDIIRAMAEGVRKGDGGNHLITYHPGGGRGSADFFHHELWLDFNMRQNGHNHWYEIYAQTRTDYDREPVKPVIDGEPIYEDHPISFDARHRGYSVAADCRRAIYWDLFNGACGHTYGHHAVWQFYKPGVRYPINHPLMHWHEAIQQPGASQVRHARHLIESRPILTRIPATERIVVQPDDDKGYMPGEGLTHIAATMDEEGTYMMVYIPVGRRFALRTSVLAEGKLKGWWFDPRTGHSHSAGRIERGDSISFLSPTPGEETDWVLVIDVASRGYKKP